MFSLAFPLHVKPNYYTQEFIHRSAGLFTDFIILWSILAALGLCCCGEQGYSPL